MSHSTEPFIIESRISSIEFCYPWYISVELNGTERPIQVVDQTFIDYINGGGTVSAKARYRFTLRENLLDPDRDIKNLVADKITRLS